MALRLSSQLQVGAVRIYQRKTRYLLDDCDDTWMTMQMTFLPSIDHDLPISLQHPDPEALRLPNEVIPYNGFELAPVSDRGCWSGPGQPQTPRQPPRHFLARGFEPESVPRHV
ncbi:hypothetical protein FSOLCH5_013319 [Fusarium solani]